MPLKLLGMNRVNMGSFKRKKQQYLNCEETSTGGSVGNVFLWWMPVVITTLLNVRGLR